MGSVVRIIEGEAIASAAVTTAVAVAVSEAAVLIMRGDPSTVDILEIPVEKEGYCTFFFSGNGGAEGLRIMYAVRT